MKLSCLVPGIRTANWRKLYDSIAKSCTKYDWEVIFVGPYPLPDNMKGLPNALWIEDWGSPIRCQQIALLAAQGDFITWAADDGEFLPDSLDISLSKLEGMDYKSLVLGKYTEGDYNTDHMLEDKYYVITNPLIIKYKRDGTISDNAYLKCVSKEPLLLNVGVISKKLLYEVGGWNCKFEVCPMAYTDLSIRLYNYKCRFIVQNEPMFKCSHMPGITGDHAPIDRAQNEHDLPLLSAMYSNRVNPKEVNVIIELSNWLNAPDRWERRFGAKPPHET